MKTTIIAVRHGETEWNKVEKQQGHLDSPLTISGRLQAEAMGDGLRECTIDVFYSSDLGRAVETSEVIEKHVRLPFVTDERLRERHLGNMQGLTKKEYRERFPDEWQRFRSYDPDYALPGGESVRQRYERAVGYVEEIALRHIGKSVLIVTHGGILMSMMYRTLRLPLHQERTFTLCNGGINVFTITSELRWNLEVWGDTHHLAVHGLSAMDDN